MKLIGLTCFKTRQEPKIRLDAEKIITVTFSFASAYSVLLLFIT